MTNYNIYGFKDNNCTEYDDLVHCDVHRGTVLMVDPRDSKMLICPECGLPKRKKRNGKKQ